MKEFRVSEGEANESDTRVSVKGPGPEVPYSETKESGPVLEGDGEDDVEVSAENVEIPTGAMSDDLICDGGTGSSEDGGMGASLSTRRGSARDVKKVEKEVQFLASDLVWGKVRSHPWWPGQIFDPWDASEEAKKHFRPNSFLVAYFGDQTFAWNEEQKLKPFWPNFSEMAKQSSAEAFCNAVDCALEEVYRRVEFALSCWCVADDKYKKLSTEIVENSGIREESCVRVCGDRFFAASCLEPAKFVPYIKVLALFPDVELEKLEVVMSRALLSAFYRWKGYDRMAEFNFSGQLFEDEAEASSLMEKGETLVAVDDIENEHVGVDIASCSKRQRRLADSVVEQGLDSEMKKQHRRKVGTPSSSSSVKKQKSVESFNSNLEAKGSKRRKGSADLNTDDTKRSLKVGETIMKIASQLHRTSNSEHSYALPDENASTISPRHEKTRGKKTMSPLVDFSPNEMLSQLQLAARYPTRGYSFLSSIFSFFSVFRDTVAKSDQSDDDSFNEISGPKTKKRSGSSHQTSKREKASKSKVTGKSVYGVEDSYWTDRIISASEESSLGDENEKTTLTDAPTPDEMAVDGGGSEGANQSEGETEGIFPTAMILNFSDADSIPSEEELNEIFSRYGALLESETEVLKRSKRAKVVFKRKSDAETAFSSSGKFKTFGPSLNSYRLNYRPDLRKASAAKKLE